MTTIDGRIGMTIDVPESVEDHLARTHEAKVPPCTYCRPHGSTPAAWVVLREWKTRKDGQLLSYCDVQHRFDPERGVYDVESLEVLRPICDVCRTMVAVNGTCFCD